MIEWSSIDKKSRKMLKKFEGKIYQIRFGLYGSYFPKKERNFISINILNQKNSAYSKN